MSSGSTSSLGSRRSGLAAGDGAGAGYPAEELQGQFDLEGVRPTNDTAFDRPK